MPRLRKIVNDRYTFRDDEDDEDLPIDVQTQEEIIANLDQSIPFNYSNRDPNLVDKLLTRVLIGFQVLLILINFLLVTVPYYRKDNSLLSCLSCTSVLTTAVIIQIEFIGSANINDMLTKYGLTTNILNYFSIIIGSVIAVYKLMNYNGVKDLFFFIPFLSSITIKMLASDIKSLNNDVNNLKKLKYNYKEA